MAGSSRILASSSTNDSFKQFFISLYVEHGEKPANVFATAKSYEGFERKYLRVYVHNKGHVVANKCTAEALISSTGDLKTLCWDDIEPLSNLSNERQIAVEGKEILNIAFSDSRSTENYVLIPTMQSLVNRHVIRREDAYEQKNFDLDLTIRSNGGAFCKAKIRVGPYQDFKSIQMNIVSQQSGHIKLERLKARIDAIIHRKRKNKADATTTA